jgi:hypothetical protein
MSGGLPNTLEPALPSELAERGVGIGDHDEAIGVARRRGPEVIELARGLDRRPRLRRHDERGAVDRHPTDGGGIGGVEDHELDVGREGAGEDLGEQARPAHAAERDAAVDGDREIDVPHRLDEVEPPQPVGDLGRVVLPQRVIGGPHATDGLAVDEVLVGGVDRGRDRSEALARDQRHPSGRYPASDATSRAASIATSAVRSMSSQVWARLGNKAS